jgi:soluble lytic murein transglycosylase-like protein
MLARTQYQWDTPEHVRKSIRMMCDAAGLTVAEKNVITACIYQESNFMPRAVGKQNSNGTTDYGLAQFNDGKNPRTGQAYWIGKGAAFATIDEVLDNPEKNVRIMIDMFKAAKIRLWASYSTGAYKKWLPYVSTPIPANGRYIIQH